MNNKLMRLAAIAGVFTVAITANATTYTFNNVINGAQEVGPNSSTASGNASGTYDDVSNMLMINITVTGLTTNTTGAHLHEAAFGVNGPVIINFGGTGLTTYNHSNMYTLTGAQETAFLASGTYVNIHTSTFPGGEVRGQLRPEVVPEPATMVVLISGIAAMMKRRRK